MRVTKLLLVRIALVSVACVSCVLFSFLCSSWLSIAWSCAVLDVLGDVSAILFGVFGIWLGMFYSPNVSNELCGKSGKELERMAKAIVADGERFAIVFRGMNTSAAVLVFAMLVRTFQVPVLNLSSSLPPLIRFWLRHAFFALVGFAVIAQCYSVLMSIAPMHGAKKKMDKAREDAETALSL